MSKKVIIDGIDVSKCKHYANEMCDSEEELSLDCIKNKTCVYKQIQKLKAEIEDLKIKNQDRLCYSLRLLRENERLKDFLYWLLKQQYYILHKNLKEKIKEILKGGANV